MGSAAGGGAGLARLQPLLTAVEGMTAADLGRQVAWFHAHGVGALFGYFGNQDAKHSDRFIAHASQSGLGLPDRDYYTKQDSASKALRVAYVDHMARIFLLGGRIDSQAHEEAANVLSLQ